jgi:hypothetical protein
MLVLQHDAPRHLPTALQIAQRRGGLFGGPGLDRDWRHLTRLAEGDGGRTPMTLEEFVEKHRAAFS